MKKIFSFVLIIFAFHYLAVSQTAGMAGAFVRMGFGARGMGMGNAFTAVTTGDLNTYYNPALSCYSIQRTVSATFGILSLDRALNFLSYTQSIQPTAGISAGIINAGVKNIDGRNSNGLHTENYSTFENQFYLAFSNRVHERVAIGVAVKLYYSKLFEEVKSTTVGFDIGAYVSIFEGFSAGIAIQDIGSKYIWDTKSIYPDPMGKTTKNRFPMLRRFGLAYVFSNSLGLIAVDFENSSANINILRFGVEYSILEYFQIRGGIDRIDFSEDATGAKPTFGFSVRKSLYSWTPAVTYSYIIESFAPHGFHIITLSASF